MTTAGRIGQNESNQTIVSIAQLGEPDRAANEAMTARVTEILQEQFDIPPKAVYVSCHGVRDWGWRGKLL